MGLYPTRLGHAHLKVRDLDRAVAFYTHFFQLEVVEQVGHQYAFLSGSAVHHELALQALGENTLPTPPQAVGLYHLAFEVPDTAGFAAALRTVQEAGIQVSTVDHLISWAMYFQDPDGNGLEIYLDRRGQPGSRPLWGGINVPIAPKALENAELPLQTIEL